MSRIISDGTGRHAPIQAIEIQLREGPHLRRVFRQVKSDGYVGCFGARQRQHYICEIGSYREMVSDGNDGSFQVYKVRVRSHLFVGRVARKGAGAL